VPATGQKFGWNLICILLALTITFCSYCWVVSALAAHETAKLAIAQAQTPHVYLNPALAHKPTLYSTAEQFTGLQDQLSARLTRHNAVMSTNLADFTSILSAVTVDADLALEHLQFVNKVISQGAGRTAEDWQGDADIVVKEAEKLRNMVISGDLHTMLENITQIALIMAAEMTDMELFMKDANSAANTLLNRLGQTVYDLYVPTDEMNAPISGAVGDQKIQWSWDEINEDGITRRCVGEFTYEQQVLLKCKHSILPSHPLDYIHFQLFLCLADFSLDFFHNMSQHGISTVVIPSVIRYGVGLRDTFPQELRSFGFNNFKTAIESVSLLNAVDNKLYHCEIVAHFGAVGAQRDVYVDFDNSTIMLPEMQFLGLQSMICGYDGEEKKDVVRQRG
jgi:hypothetical protein